MCFMDKDSTTIVHRCERATWLHQMGERVGIFTGQPPGASGHPARGPGPGLARGAGPGAAVDARVAGARPCGGVGRLRGLTAGCSGHGPPALPVHPITAGRGRLGAALELRKTAGAGKRPTGPLSRRPQPDRGLAGRGSPPLVLWSPLAASPTPCRVAAWGSARYRAARPDRGRFAVCERDGASLRLAIRAGRGGLRRGRGAAAAIHESEREAARRLWTSDPRAPLVGCVGYLLPEKGQEALVRAMPLVLKGAAGLPAGPGGRRALPLPAGTAGGRPRSRPERVLRGPRGGCLHGLSGARRVLFPSLAEPLGSSLLAAMAQALPAVGVARGAVPEIIHDGRDGLLVTASEPNEIATATLSASRTTLRWRARLGAAARETILERFSADRMVEDTLGVYRRLMNRGGHACGMV